MIAVVLAAALVGPIHVQGHAAIGAYQVRHGSYAGAVKAFGKPLSQVQTQGECRVHWRGLELRFYTLFHSKQCRLDSSFASAEVSGAWTTDRGLRRGDTLARLRDLFPRTSKGQLLRKPVYWLARKFSPAIGDYGLAVAISAGRTADLIVYDPQGGE